MAMLDRHIRLAAALMPALLSLPALAEDPAREGAIDWEAARRFWSFQPPAAVPPPAVNDRSWPSQPIDFFILARLERAGLPPAAPADRRTLARRVAFDLTGLPPAPGELEEFLASGRADAYERLVERLLASPRFGERLASLWLPLVRYAEDQAHQVGDDTKFFYPNAHLYRRWVIDAFNRDLPYDRFIRLQIAADRIDDAAPEDLAALGFLGLGPKYYNRNRLDVQADEWEDRVDTTTRTFLGLTVACARCHDHKFDPITMEDYYGLAGVFASTRLVNRRPDGSEEKGDTSAQKMDPGTIHIVADGEARDLHVFIRGNAGNQGPSAARRFLRILTDGDPEPFQNGSGRAELAAAIASPDNPLAARVLVNRLWGWIFGRPLAATPSNLGSTGRPPTHPELLDDLAVRFTRGGWSMKALIRELVLSSTYRQAAIGDRRAREVDPDNELLSRMNRRRLTIEQWRDAALLNAGELDEESPPGGLQSMELNDIENRRRTVYARISRLMLNHTLMNFDYPDANVHAASRTVTITAPQMLFLLNSTFILDRARALAGRLEREAAEPADRIRRAYLLLFGREPDGEEVKMALEFLDAADSPEMSRWDRYAQILLSSNEMWYVD